MKNIIIEELDKFKTPISITISENDSDIKVNIHSNYNVVGNIVLEKESENEYTIIDASIDDDFKGKGIYQKSLIKLIYLKPKIRINSVFRSESAERSWTLMLKNLPTDIGFSKKRYPGEGTTLFTIYKK